MLTRTAATVAFRKTQGEEEQIGGPVEHRTRVPSMMDVNESSRDCAFVKPVWNVVQEEIASSDAEPF